MNPANHPRTPRCAVCRSVAHLEDVALRLFDENGNRRKPADAIAYLRGIGMGGTDEAIRRRVDVHRKHIERWLASGVEVYSPAAAEAKVIRVNPDDRGPARWLDVQQRGMDIGDEALRILAQRLGTMEDKELIAVAKLGQTAASKRADLEAKGRHLAQVDELLNLVATAGGRKEQT